MTIAHEPQSKDRREILKVGVAALAFSLIDDVAFAGAAVGWNSIPIPADDTPPVLERMVDYPKYEAVKMKMSARKALCPVTENGTRR